MKEQTNVPFTVDKAARKSDTTRHWLTVSLNYWPHLLWPHINRVRRSPQLPGRVTPILYDQQCRFLHVSFESTTEKTTPTAWRHLSMFSIISSFITLTGSTNYLRSAERNGFVFFDVLKERWNGSNYLQLWKALPRPRYKSFAHLMPNNPPMLKGSHVSLFLFL